MNCFAREATFLGVTSTCDSQRRGIVMTERILRRPEVETRTGLSRSTLYAQMAEGAFPKPVRLGKRAVGWTESTISEWLDSRVKTDAA